MEERIAKALGIVENKINSPYWNGYLPKFVIVYIDGVCNIVYQKEFIDYLPKKTY